MMVKKVLWYNLYGLKTLMQVKPDDCCNFCPNRYSDGHGENDEDRQRDPALWLLRRDRGQQTGGTQAGIAEGCQREGGKVLLHSGVYKGCFHGAVAVSYTQRPCR